MIIIADSGSTKCSWTAISSEGIERVRTRGINAVQHSEPFIGAILAELPAWDNVEQVWFYGAGCGAHFPKAQHMMEQLLAKRFRGAEVHAESDLTGAARALFGRGDGIACILGTGSNSCYCKGGEVIENVPPLGYILGDEGSGAVLGRNLLNGIFKGYIPLHRELETEMGLSYEELIRRIYREPGANRFLGSLAPFILRHINCAPLGEMVKESFREFARRNLRRYPAGKKVAAIGSIALHFEGLLRDALREEGFTLDRVVASPDEGLINFHRNNG